MSRPQLRIRLREAVNAYEKRTGERLTYSDLAKRAGLSADTLKKMSNTKRQYNATLRTVERLCIALKIEPIDLLEWRRR